MLSILEANLLTEAVSWLSSRILSSSSSMRLSCRRFSSSSRRRNSSCSARVIGLSIKPLFSRGAKTPRSVVLDKAGACAIIYLKRTLLQQSDPHAVDLFKMTVSVPAERSSRFYTENVQYNDRTHKKLKCFLLHSRHLLPAADCGKGKEGLTAKSNSVRLYYSMHCRIVSIY